jgi:hypothetical protein
MLLVPVGLTMAVSLITYAVEAALLITYAVEAALLITYAVPVWK